MRETRTNFLYASTVIAVKVVVAAIITCSKSNMIGNSNNPTIVVKNGEAENKQHNQLLQKLSEDSWIQLKGLSSRWCVWCHSFARILEKCQILLGRTILECIFCTVLRLLSNFVIFLWMPWEKKVQKWNLWYVHLLFLAPKWFWWLAWPTDPDLDIETWCQLHTWCIWVILD